MYRAAYSMPSTDSTWWPEAVFALALCLYVTGATIAAPTTPRSEWLPDANARDHYTWGRQDCEGCAPLTPKPAWRRMQDRAGLAEVRFLVARAGTWGEAYTLPPDTLVLSESALGLPRCELNFIIGHELVHLAQRHYDEDAAMAASLSGRRPNWTRDGQQALSLMEGDFGLVLRLSDQWHAQEREADWVGSLLSAEATGCTLEDGALAYLGRQRGFGGGLASAHDDIGERLRQLSGFASMADRLRLARATP